MLPQARSWLERRSSQADDWPAERLLAAKLRHALTISVVLPALNEERTVGPIVHALRRDLVEAVPLIDELVVMDSGSTDRTAAVARAAGATVIHRDDVLPRLPSVPGKGEVLWRSLLATSGDVVCFADTDLQDFDSAFVRGPLGPLLTDPTVGLVKAMYQRPLEVGGTVSPTGGGRVTELVARPLINLHWPELAGVVQPLGGEYAARRELLELLPFPCGYGVELGLLVDVLEVAGLDAIAQVDVGVRRHRHHDDHGLGRMASEILQTALDRLDRAGKVRRTALPHRTLVQFERTVEGFAPFSRPVDVPERPPMVTVPEYARRGARAS